MDPDLFARINGLAGRERVLDILSVALSRFGNSLLLVALCLIWFLPTTDTKREQRQRLVLIAAIGAPKSLLFNQILVRTGNSPRSLPDQSAPPLFWPSPD